MNAAMITGGLFGVAMFGAAMSLAGQIALLPFAPWPVFLKCAAISFSAGVVLVAAILAMAKLT